MDGQLTPSKILTLEAVIEDSTTRENFNMLMLSVFAAVALLLAAVGIYGLMSYAVEQRTQEIGIRMALGAGRAEMMKMILGQGLRLVAAGVVIGLAAAFGLTRLLAGLLFGVKAGDPLTFGTVAVILTAVALLAAFSGPACHPNRPDPRTATGVNRNLAEVRVARVNACRVDMSYSRRSMPARRREVPGTGELPDRDGILATRVLYN